jgi:hypothetical protein
MRRLQIISTFILLTGNFLFAQNKDSVIADIRLHYSEIRANFKSYDTTVIEICDESAEGGQATAYYDKENFKLIEDVWLGETGKKQIEYYFQNGALIFAFEQSFEYNRPIYWVKKQLKKMGMTKYLILKKQ